MLHPSQEVADLVDSSRNVDLNVTKDDHSSLRVQDAERDRLLRWRRWDVATVKLCGGRTRLFDYPFLELLVDMLERVANPLVEQRGAVRHFNDRSESLSAPHPPLLSLAAGLLQLWLDWIEQFGHVAIAVRKAWAAYHGREQTKPLLPRSIEHGFVSV